VTEIKRSTALVTGAGKRIGRRLALDLARAGWCVAVHYHHSREAADQLVTEIAREGGHAMAFHADLSRESQMQALMDKVHEKMGEVTLLINNASRFEKDTAGDATRESWDRHMEVNLRAPFVLAQNLAAQLAPRSDAHIINILDTKVLNLDPHFLSYTLSKSALWTLTRTLALALAPHIRVNAIGPGPSLPNERESRTHFDRMVQATRLGRPAPPAEISRAVAFLLDQPAITGQILCLDGGAHLGWQTAEPPIAGTRPAPE